MRDAPGGSPWFSPPAILAKQGNTPWHDPKKPADAHCTEAVRKEIVDRILDLPDGTRFQVLAPVVRGRKGEYEGLLADLAQQGYTRARIDGSRSG